MTSVQFAMLAAGAILVAVSLVRTLRTIRVGLAAAGALGLYAAIATERPIATAVAAVLVLVNAVQLLLSLGQRAHAGLTPEEARMAETALPRMEPTAIRQLLDQGLWLDGRAGETLLREGEPAPHLFYLSEGEARIDSGGQRIATCRPGQFLGEITILSGAPATATVLLETHARFWCIDADALARFLAVNPGVRPALESAFVGNVAEKLRAANARLAAVE